MTKRIPELACPCGAREPDAGGAVPRDCWNCLNRTMTDTKNGQRVSRPEEGGLLL